MTDLNSDQQKALEILEGQSNVFLTGAAGSGKSYLLRAFLKNRDRKTFPVLASTGAAAILVGGRTFHSYFGLGIMEGGVDATVERAFGNKRIVKRLQKTQGIVIDEVSMLSGKVLRAAERIARKARNSQTAWGGLRVIAVGDFAQLPPVNLYGSEKDWAFLDEVWQRSQFIPIVLKKIMRSADPLFLEVLNQIRGGTTNSLVQGFLTERTLAPPQNFDGTRLLARRDDAEKYNLKRLKEIDAEEHTFETAYSGKESEIEKFKKHSPVPDSIVLKRGL